MRRTTWADRVAAWLRRQTYARPTAPAPADAVTLLREGMAEAARRGLNTEVRGRPDWTLTRFVVVTRAGEEEPLGVVRGQLGVHEIAAGFWSVTHLPTGRLVVAAHVTMERAVQLAERLSALPLWADLRNPDLRQHPQGKAVGDVVRTWWEE
ncbi:hypothetical protein [Azospirillum sp. A39]|uniref:hypothetical protein n=1 Tax=Azospirillum sp. A39 TaxID=3462279 RepID=UPI004045A36E